MKICTGTYKTDHEEIAHESRDCPLCEATEKISTLEDQINELNDQIEKLGPSEN